MSDNNNKDSDMSESSVNKILLDDEIQETEGSKIFGQPKESKDTKRKPKRLSTASTQEAGSSSPGKKKKPKIVHNPPDARGEGFVRLDKDSNKLRIDTKAVSDENKKLREDLSGSRERRQILEDEIVALRAQLATYENPGSQAAPSPPYVPENSGGLAGTLSSDQFTEMISILREQVQLYQDIQSAPKSKKKVPSKNPSADLEAPGPSRQAASTNSGGAPSKSGVAGKSRSSPKVNIMGVSLGDSGDDQDNGSVNDHNEDILG